MPGYVEHVLKWFHHQPPKCPKHAPHTWQCPTYGTMTQYAPNADHTPALNATDHMHIQEVIGVLLYYAWAVDATLLVALNTLAT